MLKLIIVIMVQACWLCSSTAVAAGGPIPRGVNLAGAEFAPERIPGVANTDYIFPTTAKIQYYKQAGFNAVRLPFTWERLQPVLMKPLDPVYLAQINKFLNEASLQNQRVVLDLHNYGRYRGNIIGTDAVPPKAFRNLWYRLAKAVGKKRSVFAYGLMNEPHDTGNRWHQVAQAGIDGIRAADTGHDIYVSGESWSNAQRWPSMNPRPFVKDPSGLVVYEAHIFFDADYSGRYPGSFDSNVNLPLLVEQRLQPFISWISTNKLRGVIGEWGVPSNDPRWQPAVDKFMDLADQNCLGWFYWAGGMWGNSYPLSLEPLNGVDRPLLERIRTRLQKSSLTGEVANRCKWSTTP